MTDEEQKIWRGVFTAAFVAEYERNLICARDLRIKNKNDDAYRYPIDRAVDVTSIEVASTVANRAILKLRQYRLEEPTCGLAIKEEEELPHMGRG